ncbi:MAG TPA: ATP-binding protein [Eubacterium sp.]|nr:ATP-binding protein [Eubacterium sp.]
MDFSAFQEKTKPGTEVKQVIGVASGKGGVGKSMVTALLAVAAAKKGLRTAILDADITGPSIPGMFGLEGRPEVAEDGGLLPLVSAGGIRVMSMNFLLDRVQDSVIWRGPMIAGVVKQFWTEVHWGEIDVMFVDMPPGTGDVPLTVYQSLPLDGIIIVTSPQQLVEMIVEKAYNMAALMNVPVLGIVENMSYFQCPDCGKKHQIFGESRIDEVAKAHGIPNVVKLPMDPAVARACDDGVIETYVSRDMDELAAKLAE